MIKVPMISAVTAYLHPWQLQHCLHARRTLARSVARTNLIP